MIRAGTQLCGLSMACCFVVTSLAGATGNLLPGQLFVAMFKWWCDWFAQCPSQPLRHRPHFSSLVHDILAWQFPDFSTSCIALPHVFSSCEEPSIRTCSRTFFIKYTLVLTKSKSCLVLFFNHTLEVVDFAFVSSHYFVFSASLPKQSIKFYYLLAVFHSLAWHPRRPSPNVSLGFRLKPPQAPLLRPQRIPVSRRHCRPRMRLFISSTTAALSTWNLPHCEACPSSESTSILSTGRLHGAL